MFAPPICSRDGGTTPFPYRQIRRRRRQLSEHPSERSEQSNMAASGASNQTWQRAERAIKHGAMREQLKTTVKMHATR
jgi:hypothetical protein